MTDIATLSDLADGRRPTGNSPRLDAVLSRLPKYARARLAFAISRADVRTLAGLCATKRAQLRHWKNVGKKSITDLEGTLASFGLTLAEHSPRSLAAVAWVETMKHKHQTPAQRVTNPVWLREQIGTLIESCAENSAEDQELADNEHDDAKRGRYLERVESHQHWKRQLERILRGKTFMEEITEDLKSAGSCS